MSRSWPSMIVGSLFSNRPREIGLELQCFLFRFSFLRSRRLAFSIPIWQLGERAPVCGVQIQCEEASTLAPVRSGACSFGPACSCVTTFGGGSGIATGFQGSGFTSGIG